MSTYTSVDVDEIIYRLTEPLGEFSHGLTERVSQFTYRLDEPVYNLSEHACVLLRECTIIACEVLASLAAIITLYIVIAFFTEW